MREPEIFIIVNCFNIKTKHIKYENIILCNYQLECWKQIMPYYQVAKNSIYDWNKIKILKENKKFYIMNNIRSYSAVVHIK